MDMEENELLSKVCCKISKAIGTDFERYLMNVYLVGSRAFGTNNKNSDYDFKMIVHNSYDNLRSFEFPELQVDVKVYTVTQFQEKIEKHDLQLLVCLFLPKSFIWKEAVQFQFFLCLTRLQRNILQQVERNWSKAFRLWKKLQWKLTNHQDENQFVDDEALDYRARKCIVHSFRFLHFGEMLYQSEKITDLTAANSLHNELLVNATNLTESPSDIAKFYEEKFKPLKKQQLNKLLSLIDKEIENATNLHSNTCSLLDFLNINGIHKLSRWFDVRIRCHDNVFHLLSHPKYSPYNVPIIRLYCRGSIVCFKNGEWMFLSLGLAKMMFYHPWEYLESRQVSKQDVLRKHQLPGPITAVMDQREGIFVLLYYHGNQWCVSCLEGFPSEILMNKRVSLQSFFWEVWENNHFKLPTNDLNYCFMFQLISPEFPPNPYIEITEQTIELIAVRCVFYMYSIVINKRCIKSLELLSVEQTKEMAGKYSWNHVLCHSVKSDLFELCINTTLGKSRGLVIRCGEEMFRYQSPVFIALANIRDKELDEQEEDEDERHWHEEDYDYEGMNRLCMVELIKTTDWNFPEKFPQFKNVFDEVKRLLDELRNNLQKYYDSIHSAGSIYGNIAFQNLSAEERRKYALAAGQFPKPYPAIVIDMKKAAETSANMYIQKSNSKALVSVLFNTNNVNKELDRS